MGTLNLFIYKPYFSQLASLPGANVRGVLKGRSMMAKGLRSVQQFSSSSQGMHFL
jgi:hypothetical protein